MKQETPEQAVERLLADLGGPDDAEIVRAAREGLARWLADVHHERTGSRSDLRAVCHSLTGGMLLWTIEERDSGETLAYAVVLDRDEGTVSCVPLIEAA